MARNQQLILGRYRPLAEAGSGGFGTVQVAWDTRIQRKVAIKCIELSDAVTVPMAPLDGADFEPVPDPAFLTPSTAFTVEMDGARDSFDFTADQAHRGPGAPDAPAASTPDQPLDARIPGLDEARTAAMLSDANIVTIHDFEVQDGMAYLIMEYVEGCTLTELMRDHDEELSLDSLAAVFAGVSHALEVAHENQVLHLDIKPDNILVNHKGQVKVTDFGLSTLADASGFGVAGGGTIGYMPLEQMRQEPLDVRCDEWALASVMYEMIAGENPFLAPDLPRAERAIEDAELVLPSLCWDELDPAVDDVLFAALDPEREARYDTVADFAEALEPFLGSAKRGVRELAKVVNRAADDDPEGAPDEADEPPAPRIPLRAYLTPRVRAAASHVLGAVGSAVLGSAALSNLPQTAGADNPLFWGLLALVAVLGAVRAHLGALVGCFMLSAALIVLGAPAAGVLLLVAAGAWWYLIGRTGLSNGEGVTGLAAPLAGAIGAGQFAPLAAGFCLRPVRAAATAAFQAFVAMLLAGCTTQNLLGWDLIGHLDFAAQGSAADGILAVITAPPVWCIALSWPIAAVVLAAIRQRLTRPFAALGTAAAGIVLVAGIALAAQVASDGATWLPSGIMLAATLIPLGAMFVACALVPDPQAYDSDALA